MAVKAEAWGWLGKGGSVLPHMAHLACPPPFPEAGVQGRGHLPLRLLGGVEDAEMMPLELPDRPSLHGGAGRVHHPQAGVEVTRRHFVDGLLEGGPELLITPVATRTIR